MLKVLSNILCDLDPKVKVIGQKAGICDGVPSTSALVFITILLLTLTPFITRDSKLKCTRFFEFGGFGSGKGGRPVKLKPISRGISTEWFKVGQIMYMPIIFTI